MAVSAKPAQDFIPIDKVRDGIIVLKDGSLRAVVLASSVNFALKSPDEQQAIIYQFQDFLNSLDFSIQIFIESRRHDIRPYIVSLEERYKNETNELFRVQIKEYIEFVKNFTQNQNIMKKRFFIVVPYNSAVATIKKTILPGFLGGGSETKDAQERQKKQFEENRTQLEQRISIIEQGLVRCGVRVVSLGSEEIIELFYKIFNPAKLINRFRYSSLTVIKLNIIK